MTQKERRIYLIQELLREEPRYREMTIPAEEKEQEDLLRALMNVRPPKPVSGEFLSVQDEYLQSERDRRGITDSDCLPSVPSDSRLILWQGDITTLKADAIVNAANSVLLGCFQPLHSCIDNMIHTRSGVQLRLLCSDIMTEQGYEEPAGRAKITPGFNLPCRYVLHTVGPIISGRVSKPVSYTHLDVYKRQEQLIEAGVLPELIRLSVGIEDAEDIITDLDQALSAV